MKIRSATHDDIAALLDMGKGMLLESRFHAHGFAPGKTIRLIEHVFQNPQTNCLFVAVNSTDEIAGFIAGHTLDYFFCDALLAQDRCFYVRPQHRGSSAAIKLLSAFRRWAELRHAHDLCINMSVAIDMPRFNKLMTRLGFSCCGSNFSLPLAQHSQHTPHNYPQKE